MKKILAIAAIAVLTIGGLLAQNTFRGTIIYKMTSTGEEPVQIPESSTAEIKVYDNKVLTSSQLFTGNPMANYVLLDGYKNFVCMDLTQLFMYLSSKDVELDYKGSSKILVTHTYTQNDIDSLTIPVTEGFYIEYVDGETKTICGEVAKKAIIHVFNDEGEDDPTVVWYCDTMGPDVNFLFNGVRGVGLEYSMNLGEGRQITITENEIKKGKVKEVDMLLPSGYDSITNEEFKELFKQIQEELEYLNEE